MLWLSLPQYITCTIIFSLSWQLLQISRFSWSLPWPSRCSYLRICGPRASDGCYNMNNHSSCIEFPAVLPFSCRRSNANGRLACAPLLLESTGFWRWKPMWWLFRSSAGSYFDGGLLVANGTHVQTGWIPKEFFALGTELFGHPSLSISLL